LNVNRELVSVGLATLQAETIMRHRLGVGDKWKGDKSHRKCQHNCEQ
jgi:hypothetical protein